MPNWQNLIELRSNWVNKYDGVSGVTVYSSTYSKMTTDDFEKEMIINIIVLLVGLRGCSESSGQMDIEDDRNAFTDGKNCHKDI
jgi:hypothetical protein